jgi:ABC-type transporter Mla subunit MlaD
MDTSTKTDATPAVAEIITQGRAYVDTVERLVEDGWADQIGELRRHELAWVIDRLDDVRGAVGSLLESLSEQLEAYGADTVEYQDTLAQMENVSQGLYLAMDQADPAGKRMNIIGL